MRKETCTVGGAPAEVYTLDAVIVGSGAAGYAAAVRLHQLGYRDIAVVTEGVCTGTSRNTGSDKQTYYKLSLAGDAPDSPAAMARDLFAGGGVDGDLALAEAALSARCFLQLCELGVPFPVNRYGEYVGYRTDHDTRGRATSAGPLTSRLMTEALEAEAQRRGIRVFDGYAAVAVLADGERVSGLLTLCRPGADREETRFVLFCCANLVWATGGPAGMYADSVYPKGHAGASGAVFEAGAAGRNMTEWQFGLASVAPRWNVSGTYMQVLPRFFSVDEAGQSYAFLEEFFASERDCLTKVFHKGYEWPFDSQKALAGSSLIDLLVYRETVLRGRRVYLDFRENPYGREPDYAALGGQAYEYLAKAGACFGTPVERLEHMNAPAVELYRSKGVDLHCEPLEIALCAQHCNGGVAVDLWWQTELAGLFCVGEAAGTHGVRRPGGSALNAGQVGALRAAQYIAQAGLRAPADTAAFLRLAEPVVRRHRALAQEMLRGGDTCGELLRRAQARMSGAGGVLRSAEDLREALRQSREDLDQFSERVKVKTPAQLWTAYRLRDCLISQCVTLCAMLDYVQRGGLSRGSALYYTPQGTRPEGLEDAFRFQCGGGEWDGELQEVRYHNGACTAQWRPVHPLPEGGGVFETVWRRYRDDRNIF